MVEDGKHRVILPASEREKQDAAVDMFVFSRLQRAVVLSSLEPAIADSKNISKEAKAARKLLAESWTQADEVIRYPKRIIYHVLMSEVMSRAGVSPQGGGLEQERDLEKRVSEALRGDNPEFSEVRARVDDVCNALPTPQNLLAALDVNNRSVILEIADIVEILYKSLNTPS